MCLGVPGELLDVRVEHDLRYGRVRFGGITRDVCLECQPEAVPGDFLLVHVGVAIAIIDREEAARAWEVLRELGQLNELDAGFAEPPDLPDPPVVPKPPDGPNGPNQKAGTP
jgi:hydrogenase expression/formation protein HypC